MKVAVLGASQNPEKYSHMAVMLLKEKGHEVYPVNPALKDVEGIACFPSISAVPGPVHTVSVYLSKEVSSKLGDDILKAGPKRIIFNPGAENPELKSKASAKGIQTLEACTLVMLRTGQF